MTKVIFDTETTGLIQPIESPLDKQPKMIEFAGIKLDENLKEIERLSFLCDPQQKLEPIITKVTGLTNKDIDGQGTFIKHLPKLQSFFLGVDEMIAHNCAFDRDILLFELQRLDLLTKFPWPAIHTCTVEKTFHINNYRLNLTNLHLHCFGTQFKSAHRAMPDVEALTNCYIYLKKEGLL